MAERMRDIPTATDIARGHINPAIFDPDFTFTNKPNMSQLRAMVQVFGSDNVRALMFSPDEKDCAKIDDTFEDFLFNQFMAHFHEKSRERDLDELFNGANEIVNYFVQTYFDDGAVKYSPINEVSYPPSSISSPFLTEGLVNCRTQPKARFETARTLALAAAYGSIVSRDKHNRIATRASDVVMGLDKGFWQTPYGTTLPLEFVTAHDNNTNRAIEWKLGRHMQAYPNEHIKSFQYQVRTTRMYGVDVPVLTNPRRKNPITATIKALRETLPPSQKTRVTDPSRSVRDSLGIMFVLLDDNVETTDFADHLLTFVEDDKNQRKISYIEEKHRVSRPLDENQSPVPQFRRYNLWYEGDTVPLEVMIYSLRDYLDSQYMVRTISDPNAPLNGVAHSLYELQRDKEVALKLFPPQLYGPEELTPSEREQYMREMFDRRITREAERLLQHNRIDNLL